MTVNHTSLEYRLIQLSADLELLRHELTALRERERLHEIAGHVVAVDEAAPQTTNDDLQLLRELTAIVTKIGGYHTSAAQDVIRRAQARTKL